MKFSNFDGGNLRNAIAREAFADIYVKDVKAFEVYLSKLSAEINNELRITEPNLKIYAEDSTIVGEVLNSISQDNLLNSLYACPHGVIKWSDEIDDFVETSTNLASVKKEGNTYKITTSQRSSVESEKYDIANMVSATFALSNCKIKHTDGYPGWAPNPKSEIIALTSKSYKKLFDQEPEVLAIHAGLECGLIGHTYPKMDMVSFGPDIRGAHSPDEKIEINTVNKFWELTLEVLKNV